MCELLGFTSERDTDISDYLRAFFAHSRSNPHGWGMMYENGGRVILREPVCASESSFLSDMTDSLPPQKTLLAHIRFATVGSINENNCQPFTGTDNSGREWTLIHNGTIFRGRHNHRYAAIQSGDTDSERFFLSLLDAMNEHISRSVPGERERFEIVSRFIAENAPMPREACAEEFLGYYSEMQKAIKELRLLYGFFCQPRMNVSAPIFSRKRTSCSAMSIVGW